MTQVPGSGRVEQDACHGPAVRDLHARCSESSGDRGQRIELRVIQDLLGASSTGRGDPPQESSVPRGDRPAQEGTQPLVLPDVGVGGLPYGQGEGVDGRSPTEDAAHDGQGREGRTQDFQDPALPMGEEDRAGVEHQRVAGPFRADGEAGDGIGGEAQPVRVGDRADRRDHVAGGAAHAQAHRYVAGEPQLTSAGRQSGPARALRHREARGSRGFPPVGRDDRERLGRRARPRDELRPAAGAGQRERDEARAPATFGVEEDALEEFAVVAGGVAGAGGGAGTGGVAGAGGRDGTGIGLGVEPGRVTRPWSTGPARGGGHAAATVR